MLQNKKNVFWEALIMTVAIFVVGLFLGMTIETTNSNKINNLYIASEISLVDATTISQLAEEESIGCESIKETKINFANKVYEEAKQLEIYETSGKLTSGLKLLHKKYDLLRTILWISSEKSLERCENYNLIVYLYEYESEDLEVKATQKVWSRILSDVTQEKENILLLPIAADEDLSSLNILLDKYEIETLPALVINNQDIVYNIENSKSLDEFLIN
ncbi:hypothetical protein HN604_01150 [archaeon]|jgi:hypothetical protein|nr:hypothetical protein [archaeon]MBT6606776.1 hypothetical protein [archaeon]MBT7660670.1 hypothetical protein [archaeon]